MDTAARVRYRRWPAPVRERVRRVWLSALPIAQCSIAAGVAWAVALHVIGHQRPFFAPVAAVLSLGLSLGQRTRRALELVLGVTLGIIVGDLLISQIGSGAWQIVLVVALAMTVAVTVDGGPLVPMQAASSAVLVATLLPPGGSGGVDRAVDALTGGVIGILIVAVIPTHPVLRARRDAAAVMATMAGVVAAVVHGLRTRDVAEVEQALQRARGTQGAIDMMRADMLGGREISHISPLYWNSRHRLSRLEATADPIDNAVRNLRVLARRARAAIANDEPVRPEIVDVVADLVSVLEVLQNMLLADPGEKPDEADAARALRTIARRAGPHLAAGGELSETVILAQLRSMLVDLLMVAGLKRESAVATLR
ncbi:FUSC family protein [Williamsia sp. CHRR-6]|nr:FUSC family protein [Williamsia sp. CHRR-6]MBT0566188.1 FUSC family protein [Williamsia sp. CHRR-6]